MPPLQKGAGETCHFQKFRKGCKVYRQPAMPPECALWNCRWLVNDDTNTLSRPDRSHYVIDVMPDFVTMEDNETKQRINVEVVQIWIDPAHPDAHRDPHLRSYLMRRAKQGVAAIVRYDSKRSILLFAPGMFSGEAPAGWLQPDGWIEVPPSGPHVKTEAEHTLRDTMEALR